MRAIVKGPEPHSLTTHRLKPHGSYDNYPTSDKDALRRSLVDEQRGLCCYCMKRIGPASAEMKIEHWQSQARYPERELDYRNLLGSCRGNEGQPSRFQHCDTKKGEEELLWNPANPDHPVEERMQCDSDGTIRSSDSRFDKQLNEVLNLNLTSLKSHRKNVLTSVLHWWRKQPKPVPRKQIERQRDRYTGEGAKLTPYCQVAVWWLNRKLARQR